MLYDLKLWLTILKEMTLIYQFAHGMGCYNKKTRVESYKYKDLTKVQIDYILTEIENCKHYFLHLTLINIRYGTDHNFEYWIGPDFEYWIGPAGPTSNYWVPT